MLVSVYHLDTEVSPEDRGVMIGGAALGHRSAP
jgi:hypothetical protein